MRQRNSLSALYWLIYAIVLFLLYHLLVKIAFLDGSWIAFLLFIPLLAISYFLPRPEERRQVAVFTLGFLLLDRSLTRLDAEPVTAMWLGGAAAVLVVALLARWYGRLRWQAIIALVLVAVIANTTFNRDNLAVLNHFTIKWESERLYNGEWVDYFPIVLHDVNGDGTQEIITYGNKDELPAEAEDDQQPETEAERKAYADKLIPLKPEPVSLYVYTWQNGEMVRFPNNQLSSEALAAIADKMPADFPGYPYYTMKDAELVPNVQRQNYAEAMMQVGTAPYRAFLLDMLNITHLLDEQQGKLDMRTVFSADSKFRHLVLEQGELRGIYDGKPFRTPTLATRLVATMRLADGREGLIVLGDRLSILTVHPDGTVEESWSLTTKQIELANAEFIPADIDQDQADELLIAGSPSYILKPTATGVWEILWASEANDPSFRFSAFASVGDQSEPLLIAQAKSWVSSNPLRYLSGFRYSPDGLEQQWKIYLPLINIRVGDVDGDKENEIVASIYDTHRLLVLKQHDIPVLPLMIILLIGMLGYGVRRRFRHA